MAKNNHQKPIIRFENISKKYNEYGNVVNALNNVFLKIFPGEFVSIIGASGSGKSTLLHCMGLLDNPSSGKIFVEEKDTSKITGKEIALLRGEKIGFVFQSYNLIPRLTVIENIMLPGLIMKKNPEELEEKASVLLNEVGIAHRSDHKGVHLSGGEQQRVAIARALINDPVLILADEPTGALDSDSSKEIMNILVKMNEKRKVTSVFVSHEMNIAGYGKRTIVLKDGKILADSKKGDKDFQTILKETHME